MNIRDIVRLSSDPAQAYIWNMQSSRDIGVTTTSHGRPVGFNDLLPDELIGRHLIVFDGVCVLCSSFARSVAKLDRHDRFRFATAQSPLGEALFRRFGLPTETYETNLVLIDGVGYQRLDSLIATMAALGWPWRAARMLSLLPCGLSDWLYHRIARNRYALFGRKDSCDIADLSLRRKLIG